MMRKIVALAMPATWMLVFCLVSQTGLCHTTRLSSAKLQVTGSQAAGQLEVNGLDLQVALDVKLNTPEGNVDPLLAGALRGRIFDYLLGKTRVLASDGVACAGRGLALDTKADHVLATLEWQCGAQGPGSYESTLFQEIDPAARHMLTATGAARAFALLSSANPRASLQRAESKLGEVLWRYFLSGVEHIAIGYDHIAFLLAVILWGRRFWPLAAAVTAFTLAHSVTLSLAVLDIVQLPSRWVELAIALSIVYVAAENFFVRDLGRRWIITFVFGLIHGFGFASVLREFGIPQDKIGWALAAFNVGVEAGQLAIVAIALGALYAVGRLWPAAAMGSERRRPFVWGVSGLILLLGLYWTVQRLSG